MFVVSLQALLLWHATESYPGSVRFASYKASSRRYVHGFMRRFVVAVESQILQNEAISDSKRNAGQLFYS